MKNIGLLVVLLYVFYIIIISIRNVLIGKGRINHPLYDDDQKRKYLYRRGVIGLTISLPVGVFMLVIVIMALL